MVDLDNDSMLVIGGGDTNIDEGSILLHGVNPPYHLFLFILTGLHMVIYPFNLHRTVILFTEHIYIFCVIPSLRYR